MPLPDFGYSNRETRKKQELVFPMAPEIVKAKSSPLGGSSSSSGGNQTRGQVTTGKLGIDLERKLVIHGDRDKDVWSSPKVDPSDLAEARRYAAPERKNLRSDVRSTLDSLISSSKARQVKSARRPTMGDEQPDPSIKSYASDAEYARRPSSTSFSSSSSPPLTTPMPPSSGSFSSSLFKSASPPSSGRFSVPSSTSVGSQIRLREEQRRVRPFGSFNSGTTSPPPQESKFRSASVTTRSSSVSSVSYGSRGTRTPRGLY